MFLQKRGTRPFPEVQKEGTQTHAHSSSSPTSGPLPICCPAQGKEKPKVAGLSY
jgi:hypothetical protein